MAACLLFVLIFSDVVLSHPTSANYGNLFFPATKLGHPAGLSLMLLQHLLAAVVANLHCLSRPLVRQDWVNLDVVIMTLMAYKIQNELINPKSSQRHIVIINFNLTSFN